jgi:bifunctional non-homologous end joining protein LigD
VDPSAITGARRGPLPTAAAPQLAVAAAAAPAGPLWLHEIKHDGYRLFARIAAGEVRLLTRNRLDWTAKFPELAADLRSLQVAEALIDGEIVCVAPDGTTSFPGLQQAIAEADTGALAFYAFDLLHLDGWDLTGAALDDRKAALAALVAPTALGRLRYSDHQIGHGPEFLEEARRVAVEGIVSKRRDRPYRPGRSDAWRKVKCLAREEFVVIGFTDPEGSGRDGFGALLLGGWDAKGALRYAGRAGTGFNAPGLVELRRRLDALAPANPPVALPKSAPKKGAHWVEPVLVAVIDFAGRTTDGVLWHPRFIALRDDKPAAEVLWQG